MKIALAQIHPKKGDIAENIKKHLHFINASCKYGADLIVFPELSLTGYEPGLAEKLALKIDDERFDIFQKTADENNVYFAIGAPIRTTIGIHIGLCIFTPQKARKIYTKQFLHPDEEPYFKKGKHSTSLLIEKIKIEFAICYEISIEAHAKKAHERNAGIYIASVAKSANGVEQATKTLSSISEKYGMTSMMVNNIGFCDNFEGGGKSSIWDKKGKLIEQLNNHKEGIIIFDTETQSKFIYSEK